MKKALTFMKSKLALAGVVVIAAVIGGATTSLVRASIPDGNGTIHSCYSTARGSMYIIDSSSQSCGTGETGLNWSQDGGRALHDASGQFLGNVINTPGEAPLPWVVYNPTLNRIIYIAYSSSADKSVVIPSVRNALYFESSDCTGQAYTFNDLNSNDAKTNLIRTGSSSYGIVQDNASAQTKTASSIKQYDLATDTFSCQDITDATDSYYEISSVSLPFSTPLDNPFKF